MDAANYLRGDEGLDVLYAHRPEALRLLAEAETRDTGLGHIRVVGVEGLIAFKLQALTNDPSRLRDNDDIRALLYSPAANIDMVRVRRYFALFERESWLDALLRDQGEVPGGS